MRCAVWCSAPSGPVKQRSSGRASGPSRPGSTAAAVRSFASRYSGAWTTWAYSPSEALFTNVRPFTSARSMCRSTRVRVGIERSHHVGPVQSQIEGEVVAGAGRNAHVVQAGPGRDRGDQRLRAIPARHAQHVRAAADRVLGEFPQVVAGFQEDRLDSPLPALDDQLEPLHLSPAGLSGS